MTIESLRKACTGAVITAGDAPFLGAIHENLWNKLIPDRAPQIVVKAADEADIIATVRFARANGLKVAVRGGSCSAGLPGDASD